MFNTFFKRKESVLGSSLSTGRFATCMAMISSLFFLWGLSYGLLDSLNKHFQDLFNITKAESTGLQGVYFGAYALFSIPASIFITKYGYKTGIICSLSVFTIGAICFWPSAKAETYAGFLACTFVIGAAIASLEVCSNSYVCVIAGQKRAALWMTFAQGCNGISAFAGPLIASQLFFTGENLSSFKTVQYVYLVVGLIGISLAILFAVVKFPEVRQDSTAEEDRLVQEAGYTGLLKSKRLMWGFFAEWLYVGAQVSVASLAINYFVETTNVSAAQAANLYAYCQMTFMFGRFASVPLLAYVYPPLLLGIYGLGATIFAILVSQIGGKGGAFCLFMVFFFESVCYPIIFSEATLGLGPYQKYGSAFIAMGVSGGAWFPTAQATLADAKSTKLSYIVAGAGFIAVAAYGFGLCIDSWRRNGFHYRILDLTENDQISRVESIRSGTSEESKSETGAVSLIDSTEGKVVVEEIEEVKI